MTKPFLFLCGSLLLVALAFGDARLLAAANPIPTHGEVAYGPSPHQRLDIYLPTTSGGPAPVLIWFGGIWEPSKTAPNLSLFLPAHIAVISVEVRTLNEGMQEKADPPVSYVMNDACRAVQFVRLNAAKWNLDARRIAVGGGSQGTLPALYVGCAGERADPNSKDPVERTSTMVTCVAAYRSQPSIDPRQMQEWVPGVKWGAPALGCSFEESLRRRDELLPVIEKWSPEALLHKGAAPIYFENNWGLTKPDNIAEMDYKVHSPAWALGFQKLAQRAGVACHVKFPGHPTDKYKDIWDFLVQELTSPTAVTKLPNILIILTDDQGRGDFSAFGTKDIHTPNIDRLFHEGMTLENFYANSCVCSPSRAALLTGCYPDRVGVPGVIREEISDESWGCLAARAVLLPTLLKPAGYHTAIVGKWHLGISSPNTPNDRGFDLFEGFLGDMMEDYWTHLRHGYNFMRHNAEVVQPKGHATDVFTEWACQYLEERSKSRQPFFLYLAYNAPHDPIQPPPDWLEKVRRREPNMPENRAKLVALIEHLDAGIGRVLDTLDKTGLAENTLVMFSSDNGGVLANGANNGPWRGGKEHMYEGGLRVPFAARWPGWIKPASSSRRIALTMDMFPTALAAAGIAPPAGIDGVSLLPTLLGTREPEPRKFNYFIRREGGPVYGGKTIEALRLGDWKLLQDSPFAPLELYDLKSDPLEKNNLADQQRDVRAKLDAALRRQIQIGGAVPWQPAN